MVRNLPASTGELRDTGSIPGLGRSPGGGNGNLLQYPCLEKPMDREAWQYSPWGHKESDMTKVTWHTYNTQPCVSFISLSTIFSRFIHVVACISFLLMAE